ncbi:hypothetical protein NIES2101_13480 [Calothrix sp. HK-06]|nr:hypothetical protein NIES2101_13480 [Calothrix sp. HK-06]
MNLSSLKWVKVVTPPSDYQSRWAYSPKEIEEIGKENPIINSLHGLTIFPLGFKSEKASYPDAGDLMLLTQHAKITHIVEIVDSEPYKKGSHEKGLWFHRYVKIVWWKPEKNWEELPHREKILEFDISVRDGNPYQLTSFNSFIKKWGDGDNSLEAFKKHLVSKLVDL